ncbi:hypothetical protein RGF97_33025 [Streptomyces roseicoloratus]|uniref:Uncharacterized protein n=1 Tax=Streptomyces roseicoloratus TaxID=2508722 RepID=A0ABY9S6Q1_9ACTN|nr:hypothetical protein [Streptomyces roseicoloratus]WMX48660.1 hypothetical protein RGF97_33025 [Streptomyces roseicoloratus]
MVREADSALLGNATYSQFCATILYDRIGRRRSDPDDADGRDDPDDSAGGWRAWDQRMHAAVFEVVVPDGGTTVRELAAHCLRRARETGAAQPDPASVREASQASPVSSASDALTGEPNAAAVARLFAEDHVSRVWLCDAATDQRLPDLLPVSESALADGDLVVLMIEHQPPGMYMLAPARNAEELLRWLPLREEVPGPSPMRGVLLYTEADIELAAYVRTHFHDLNALSGPDTLVFALERRAGRTAARRYWRRHLEPEVYRVMTAVRWLRWVPYDPHSAYEVAARLGIEPESLPCLAFLQGPDGPVHLREKVVFPVEHTSTAYFRALFGGIRRVLDPTKGNRLMGGTATEATTFAALRNAEADIKEALRPLVPAKPELSLSSSHVTIQEARVSMSENFTFNGQTTFINRPQDAVIRDFQNTYPAAAGTHDLARLLHLTLTSRDIPDQEREAVAAEIHRLADLVDEAEPDVPAALTRIDRLRAMLTSAADIAQPALTILASLSAILGA